MSAFLDYIHKIAPGSKGHLLFLSLIPLALKSFYASFHELMN